MKKILLLLFISVIAIGAIVFAIQQNKAEMILLDSITTDSDITKIYTYKNLDISDVPCVFTQSNIAVYDKETMLRAEADLVVMGSVETTLAQDKSYFIYFPDNSLSTYYTISSFRVDAVLSGTYDEKYLDLMQGAAVSQNENGQYMILAREGYIPLNQNDTYVLYLKHVGETSRKKLGENAYGALGVYHGIINLSEPAPKSRLSDTHYDTRMSSIRQGVLERFSSELKAEGVFIAE